jgi:hypothetical protein
MGTVDNAAGGDGQKRPGPVPHYREPVPNSTGLPATRVTRQRKAVADLLSEFRDFRSAQQIHAILRERGDNIGLGTVYRTLGLMVHSGQVDVLTREDGETVYLQCSPSNTTTTSCAARVVAPSRSPAGQSLNGPTGLPNSTGTPTSATPWKCSASARAARPRIQPPAEARSDRPRSRPRCEEATALGFVSAQPRTTASSGLVIQSLHEPM